MASDFEPIDPEALPEGTVSEQSVKAELSAVETLLSGVSGTDDYLEAIVRNQRIQLLQSGVTSAFGPSRAEEIPAGVLGRAIETINEQQTGEVLFEIGGSKRVYTYRSTEDIADGDQVRVREDGMVEQLENESAAAGNTLSEIVQGEKTLTNDNFTNISWGFRASAITVVNDTAETATNPVTMEIRFKDPDKDASNITITPDDRTLSLSGVNGIGAKSVWVRQVNDQEDRDVRVIAVE